MHAEYLVASVLTHHFYQTAVLAMSYGVSFLGTLRA